MCCYFGNNLSTCLFKKRRFFGVLKTNLNKLMKLFHNLKIKDSCLLIKCDETPIQTNSTSTNQISKTKSECNY